MSDTATEQDDSSVAEVVRRFWGFRGLRPLQAEAIRAGIVHRDSLVVMPTGGGKSLCYQVPPIVTGRTDIVVSPLISLMKDQVDGLRACGYPATALHSGLRPDELRASEREVAAGRHRLIFVAPERLLAPSFMGLIQGLDVRAFAIDEAHCISHWGHNFRPEYRSLSTLKRRFRRASVHAYTATATGRVRDDIVEQLGLVDPKVLVGRFDRPNLTYRVVPRVDGFVQVREVLRRHPGRAAIVYCITRRETEAMANVLAANGIRAAAYHAGLDADQRRRTQDDFSGERLDVVAATVAFGMGIDRSDVRCVIHAAMPKSIEHYQQETGRAGRDGLEAECVCLYSPADVMKWESILSRAADTDAPVEAMATPRELLRHMQQYCRSQRCRHRALVEYFGQDYEKADCGACDICLGEQEGMEDATEPARMVLSCVARLGERFGIGRVVDVLCGADTEPIRRQRHDALSTFGLMGDVPRKTLMSMVYQLIDQELLDRTGGDRPILQLNDASWEVLRGSRTVLLPRQRVAAEAKKARVDTESWEGVDRELFEKLRTLRRELSAERGVPAYIVFGDATLRDLARKRPQTLPEMSGVYGVGERKLADFGQRFLEKIGRHLEEKRRSDEAT